MLSSMLNSIVFIKLILTLPRGREKFVDNGFSPIVALNWEIIAYSTSPTTRQKAGKNRVNKTDIQFRWTPLLYLFHLCWSEHSQLE